MPRLDAFRFHTFAGATRPIHRVECFLSAADRTFFFHPFSISVFFPRSRPDRRCLFSERQSGNPSTSLWPGSPFSRFWTLWSFLFRVDRVILKDPSAHSSPPIEFLPMRHVWFPTRFFVRFQVSSSPIAFQIKCRRNLERVQVRRLTRALDSVKMLYLQSPLVC